MQTLLKALGTIAMLSLPLGSLRAHPQQTRGLGVHVAGDKVIVVAQASGETPEAARENATMSARRDAQATRSSHVESLTVWKEGESSQGGGSFDYNSQITIKLRGNLHGSRVVKTVPSQRRGEHVARVTLEVPRERIYPSWKIDLILNRKAPEGIDERQWRRDALLNFMAEAKPAGDFEAIEIACNKGLLKDPCSKFVIELAHLKEDLGDQTQAIRVLERWKPRIPETDRAPIEGELRRLRGVAVGAEALLKRLRRVVSGAYREELKLGHDLKRAKARDKVIIRGTAPLAQAITIICIDAEGLATPRALQQTAESLQKPLGPGSSRTPLNLTWAYGDPSDCVPGELRLIFLSRAPDSPPVPLLKKPIDLQLCKARVPDKDELQRLENYIKDLAAWLNYKGNQAQELSWMQVR